VDDAKLAEILGTTDASAISCEEFGDGNLNFVFKAVGPRATLIVKQALPFVRCVPDEGWPLTADRAYFEHEALIEQSKRCPEHVPEVYLFDRPNALIVMRYIQPPHIILRKALIAREKYEPMADHLSTFLAQTLFHTSALALSGSAMRERISKWSMNHPMCALTEQVVFTEPYYAASNNHWTAPQLDADAAALRTDAELILAVSELKASFLGSAQALIHGDLHTGSVMVPSPALSSGAGSDSSADASDTSTFVIDPEFGFYGPIGFDVGAVVANLLLSYCSQRGHGDAGGNCAAYEDWILAQLAALLDGFRSKFLVLWETAQPADAELFPRSVFGDSALRAQAQKSFMERLLADSLGFAGCKMIRRVVGIAHVEDLDSIADAEERAACERAALALGRRLVVERRQLAAQCGEEGGTGPVLELARGAAPAL
jgi:5-methylthioribose kinase